MEDIIDRASCIEYFMTLPTSLYNEDDLNWVLDLMIKDMYSTEEVVPWSRLANTLFNWRLMDQHMPYGWIAPDGKLLTNDYAIHEQWTYLLGFDSRYSMELAGYIHYSTNQFDKSFVHYQSTWRANAKQRRSLKKVGCEIDNAYELSLPIRPEDRTDAT